MWATVPRDGLSLLGVEMGPLGCIEIPCTDVTLSYERVTLPQLYFF